MKDSHPWPLYTACIGQHFIVNTDRNGMGCTILSDLALRTSYGPTGHLHQADGYRVLWNDGVEALVEPKNLRRRTNRQPDRRTVIATGLNKILDLFKERETT